jgi:hypothetical protein
MDSEYYDLVKSNILVKTNALTVEFIPCRIAGSELFVINCHFCEEQVQLLDLREQGHYYEVINKERVRKFSRITAATAVFVVYPHFVNSHKYDKIGVSLFLHYPEQPDEYPINLYGTNIILDEMKNISIENYRQLFPFFTYEGSHIEDIYSKKYNYPKSFKVPRLTEDCCD